MGRIVPVPTALHQMFESRPILDAATAMEAVELLGADPSLGWLAALSEGREATRLQRGFSCTETTQSTSDLTVLPHLDREPAPRMQDLIRRGYSPAVAMRSVSSGSP